MLVRKGSTDERRELLVGAVAGALMVHAHLEEVETEVYSGQMATKIPTTDDTELLHFRAGKGLED